MKEKIYIHLDPLGGISGDMFVAAMIDCDKKLKDIAIATQKKILNQANLHIKKGKNQHIEGTIFSVSINDSNANIHRTFQDIKNLIMKCKISEPNKKLAIEMFTKLAKVESLIHGTTINKVNFHEVGAWDSIIDIVISAKFIEYLSKKYDVKWSYSEIPLGEGFVITKHGKMPIPAPATALLLKNFSVYTDGIKGERVTPTGALILSTIAPKLGISPSHKNSLIIKQQGIGIGEKDFKTIPNILRILIFKESKKIINNIDKQILSELIFNIDDQSPEDLSLSLENLRKSKGVLEVIHKSYVGKKNRIVFEIKILCNIKNTKSIIKKIFLETATLGIRHLKVDRFSLHREIYKKDNFNIKISRRPYGKITKKVESNDLKNYSYQRRKQIRKELEK